MIAVVQRFCFFMAVCVLCVAVTAVDWRRDWLPTRPELDRKIPDYLRVSEQGVFLKGAADRSWILFESLGTPAREGNHVDLSLQVSGKGVLEAGFYAYDEKGRCVGQSCRPVPVTSVPAPVSISVPVLPRTSSVKCCLKIGSGAELLITDFRKVISGTPLPTYAFITERNHENARYAVGETARVSVTVMCDGKKLTHGDGWVTIRHDGVIVGKQKFNLATENPVQVCTSMKQPGFALLSYRFIHIPGDKSGKSLELGMAFSPDRIEAGVHPPEDLLSYWHGEYEKFQRAVPPQFQLTRVADRGAFRCFRLTSAHYGGTRTHATLTFPKQVTGKLPMVFTVPPAGMTVWGGNTWPGAIRLTVSVHGRDFKDASDYRAFNRPVWYFKRGATSRESFYYYKSILGVMRMMEYAMTQVKEWDGRHLAAVGRSQGGGFAFIMAALNPKIMAVAADVPALCDHQARRVNRRPGWPQLLDDRACQGFEAHSPYFDAANFAAFVSCPSVVTVGYIDTMCVPSSVYAAFNRLKGIKTMIDCRDYGHGWGKRTRDAYDARDRLLHEVFRR